MLASAKFNSYIQNKNALYSFLLLSILYFGFNYFYFDVNPLVNYMWKLEIVHSSRNLILNYVFVVLIFLNIPKNEIFEYHFFMIILIGIFMPITVISNHTSVGLFACFIYFICISLSITTYKFFNRIFNRRITIAISKKKLFTESFLLFFNKIITSLVLSYLISTNWSRLTSFNLFETLVNVYSIREDNTLTGLDSYLPGWLISIFIPILLVSYFKKKDFFSLLIAVVGIFFMFQIFAMKIQLFSILLIYFFGIIYIKYNRLRIFSVELFYVSIFFISVILGSFMYPFLDRFFYLPGQLNLHYFEFFASHPKNYFHGSKLGIFFEVSNYSKPMGFVIDDFFYGGGMNANTGYLASSFGDLGYIGLILASFVISILCYFFSILNAKSEILAYVLSIQFGFTLINAPLTDLFISNGLLYLFFIIMLLKAKNTFVT